MVIGDMDNGGGASFVRAERHTSAPEPVAFVRLGGDGYCVARTRADGAIAHTFLPTMAIAIAALRVARAEDPDAVLILPSGDPLSAVATARALWGAR